MMLHKLIQFSLLTLAMATWLGCGQAPPAKFTLNYQGDGQSEYINSSGARQIVSALQALFGTPDDPFVIDETKLNKSRLLASAGPTGTSKDGKHGLYRQHCVHCHGISGDGAGPTAAFLNPYPRDYRAGKYKFKSTQRAGKPTSADLERIIRDGIPGTAMPSFALLPEDEVKSLVEYVKYLTIRGEVETVLWQNLKGNDGKLDLSPEEIKAEFDNYADQWLAADSVVIAPEDYPSEELKNDLAKWKEFKWDEMYPDAYKAAEAKKPDAWHKLGESIFKGPKAQCMKYHGPTGLGDGSEEALFDDWNKDKKRPGETGYDPKTYWTLAKQDIRPRSFRTNIFRFGRSPADIYRRVVSGINGTPMPDNSNVLKNPAEIWALVDYVRAMPFQHPNQPPHQTATMVRDRQ